MVELVPSDVVDLGGVATDSAHPTWADLALWEDGYVETSLATLGLPRPYIEAGIEQVNQEMSFVRAMGTVPSRGGPHFKDVDMAQEWYRERQTRAVRRALQSLSDFIHRRDFEVVETTTTEVAVPLYLLSAPAVAGCGVEVERTETASREFGWYLTLLGTGVEGGLEGAVEVGVKLSADQGELRQVFLPVHLETSRIVTTEKGKVIGSGYAHQVHGINGMKPGVFPLAGAGGIDVDDASAPDIFPLEHDAPNRTAVYTLKAGGGATHTLSVGFKAFNADQTLRYKAGWSVAVQLSCTLVGGHRYVAHQVLDRLGLLWTTTY